MNSKFLSLSIVYIIGLILFLNGFLLTRRVILKNSNGIIPLSKPNEFKQIILIIIDALRYDFIKPNNNNSIINNYQNQMPFIRKLLETKSKQSILLKLIADPPTTTLQRLKALTTGTLPTFIDISYNFIGYEIEEDNILNQLKKNSYRRNISLLGDDTWLALYPNIEFKNLHVYPSFDVHDLDTVDNGILENLWNVIQDNQQYSFIIAHFLGVDHCGHRYGPLHIEMKRKLNQMDDVIQNITLLFNKINSSSSLLMVIGDHGMTQQGDHGGDQLNEIETAMFIYTNKENYFLLNQTKEISVSQIDLVPTLSWFLHILIPFSNLGMIIIDIIPIEQRYIAMKLNFQQIEIYLKYISLTIPLSDKLQQLRADLRTIFISFNRQNNLTMIENLFQKFQLEFQTHFRRQWSTFNIFRIIIGLFIMLISCLILIFMYFRFNRNENMIFNIIIMLMYFSISFSNSFIINEGICLYFLLQTIILTTKMNILQKILLSFLLFLTRLFLICREEQQPYCFNPLWLISKSSDTSNYILPLISAIIWLFILSLTCNYILPYISFLCVIGYWFNISHILSIYYLSIIIQICFVLFNPSRFDTLIYSILIFVVGYRFSFVIFLQYFIYYITLNNNNNRSLSLFLCILTDYFFYATGHQPVLSQIRWTVAFPTENSLSLIINSLFIRGLFVIIETFSCQILNIILIRKMIEKKFLLKNILIIDYWKLMNTSLSVFIFRRHLMLWKIFSPRFLFQLIGFFIKILFVCLTIKLKK
jgi:predicted AlkP superfamily pyrophosphatase or phosphodiesterase